MAEISEKSANKIRAIIKKKGNQIYDSNTVNFEDILLSGIKNKKIRNSIKKPTHGGKRKGAGRKKGSFKNVKPKEPTVIKRIPISKLAAVEALIKG